MPILDSSTQVFNRAAASAAAQSDLSSIGGACGTYAAQIGLMSQQFDGIPHPTPWWWAVGKLHGRVMGAYHYILGASQACQTSAGNGDSYGTATAVSDMSQAAQSMQRFDQEAHSLSAKA